MRHDPRADAVRVAILLAAKKTAQPSQRCIRRELKRLGVAGRQRRKLIQAYKRELATRPMPQPHAGVVV